MIVFAQSMVNLMSSQALCTPFYYNVMIVDKFNRNLQKYSHNLTTLRMLRSAASQFSAENVLTYLASFDAQEKGYFTPEEIQYIWLCKHAREEQEVNCFISKFFNFQKISYTIILNFLTQKESHPHTMQKQEQLDALVNKIFGLALETTSVQAAVVDKMEHFVPMKYSRPTQEELSRYVICQQLTVDIREVSKSLNLLQNNQARSKKQEIDYEKTLANPSVNNLQDIMKRLQNRVTSFGGEWMITKQLQK